MIDWLFEKKPHGWIPQRGVARGDKKCLKWYPGAEPSTPDLPDHVFLGYTQAAFPTDKLPMREQVCAVCWVGLDIDLDLPPTFLQVEKLKEVFPEASLRISAGGCGLHVIWRLQEPPILPYAAARSFVKTVAGAKAKDCPLPVCSSDFRLFYLTGGSNRWIHQTDRFLENATPVVVADLSPKKVEVEGNVPEHPLIQWINQNSPIHVTSTGHYRVHVGTLVKALRELGEEVDTASPGQNGWHTNGFLDVSPNEITLFSFADHRVIWSWQNTLSWLEGFCE